MNSSSMQQASDFLVDTWQRGAVVGSLPADIRPSTRAQGYAIQALIEKHSAKPLYGWKIAATSAAGQAHIGVDGPMAGRLLAERVIAPGGTVPPGPNRMSVAEPEFAFRMARSLTPRVRPYSVDEVLAAVASLHPAIEVPDSRYEDFANVGGPQLIADNACAHYFMAGEAATVDWRSIDLASHVVVATVDGKYSREGSGANVLGNPRIALTWLANELSSLGTTLKAGQFVTTGVCVKPLEVEPGDSVNVDFGVFGRLNIRF